MASDNFAVLDVPLSDRSRRAREIVDQFEKLHQSSLPPPGSDSVPRPGRHVRCSAETVNQIYTSGKIHDRDARGRATARGQAAPSGWSVRLAVVDCAFVPTARDNPGSRADPEFLRAQRRMADPAFVNALGAHLRAEFTGRLIQTTNGNYFVPRGIIFVREASISVPLGESEADDIRLLSSLATCAEQALAGSPNGEPVPSEAPPPEIRRGHLRLVQ
ncbi:MAG: hypothetical protein EPO26_02040 [Chloroflexota bacterium]|nr:MAG: hypothetical protein EPO26_02040 [Chloroflexota bacterium]